jgi:enamine deaminase RidA (YjgF/YER057c/UK114 family)
MNRHIRVIRPEGLATHAVPISEVIVCDNLVWIAAQGGVDANDRRVSESFAAEARQVFENMRRCLASAKCGFEDVIRINAWLADPADFDAFNEITREYFSAPYPVRSIVTAGIFGYRVAADAIARLP